MRVLCINDKPAPGKLNAPWVIKFGETYDVINEFKVNDRDYYELSVQPEVGYWINHFAPCSSIDETELVSEREEVSI